MTELEVSFYRTLTRWICGCFIALLIAVAAYNIVDRMAPVRYVTSQQTIVK